jgi:hypothetical protein
MPTNRYLKMSVSVYRLMGFGRGLPPLVTETGVPKKLLRDDAALDG